MLLLLLSRGRCLEKFAGIDVFTEVLHLLVAKPKIFNDNIQNVLYPVLSIIFYNILVKTA